MRRVIVPLVVLLCLGVTASAGFALANESAVSDIPLASSLREGGWTVETAAAPLHALRIDPLPPELLIVGGSHTLTQPETDAILRFARAGGEAWLVAPVPEGAFARFDPPRAAAGAIYDEAGDPASSHDGTLSAEGLRALLLPHDGWVALHSTESDAFRDTNGNGVLDEGEPVGPFVVAAGRPHGAGRVVVVAADGPGAMQTMPAPSQSIGRAVIAAASQPPSFATVGASIVLIGSLGGASFLIASAMLAVAILVVAAVSLARQPSRPADPDAQRMADAVTSYLSNK